MNPFGVRSFRYQWPADLATSWAFEMEALILGWYILSATGSVQSLVAFASLTWLGAVLSPFFGVAGDRFGQRTLLCATRAAYALLAAVLGALTLGGRLEPWHVFVIAALAGLMRPSEMVMRNVLVAQTVQPAILMNALGISRTTSDTARIAGALAGTGSVALVGMGPAYVAVAFLYASAFVLSLGVARPRARGAHATAKKALAGLREALGYVWSTPDQLGAFSIAFLVNLLAFPFFLGLLPYVAKDVYAEAQTALGYLAAAFACGALAGSLVIAATRLRVPAGRSMLASAAVWFVAVLLFGRTQALPLGIALCLVSGFAQSLCLTPLAAVMLRTATDEMRGRVMGMRMLAVWGLPLGLVAAGPIIAQFGFAACTLIYSAFGLVATLAIAYRWRRELWHRAAPANAH